MAKKSNRVYSMSMFASRADLYEAMSNDYQDDLQASEKTVGELEIHLLTVARENDRLREQNDRLERLLARHEEG